MDQTNPETQQIPDANPDPPNLDPSQDPLNNDGLSLGAFMVIAFLLFIALYVVITIISSKTTTEESTPPNNTGTSSSSYNN